MAFGLLSRLFGRRKLPAELRYEDARQVLESHHLAVKRELAGREEEARQMSQQHQQVKALNPDVTVDENLLEQCRFQ